MPKRTGQFNRVVRFKELPGSLRRLVLLRSAACSLASICLIDFIIRISTSQLPAGQGFPVALIIAGYIAFSLIAGILALKYEISRAGETFAIQRNGESDRQFRNLLLAAAGNIREAVIAVNRRGNVTYMNQPAESFTGWNFPCAREHQLSEILKLADPESGRPLVHSHILMPASNSEGHSSRKVIILSQTGKETIAEESLAPISDEYGNNAGSVLIYRDISGRILNDDIIDFSGIGLMQYTIDGTIVRIDTGSLRILDLAETYPDPATAVGQKLSDLITYSRSLRKVQKEILRKGMVKGLEYSIITLKGKTKWLRHDSRITVDGATGEKVIRVIIRDITGRKAAQYELEEKSFYLDNILSANRDTAVIATDKLFGIKYLNETAETTLGISAESVTGTSLVDLHALDKMDLTSFDKAIEAVKYGGEYTYRAVRRINGEKRTIEAVVSGMHHKSKRLEGYIITARDITEQERIEHNIERHKIILKKPGEFRRDLSAKENEAELPVPV